MKKITTFLCSALIVGALFNACKKDDTSTTNNNNNNNGGGTGNLSYIKVNNSWTYDIFAVGASFTGKDTTFTNALTNKVAKDLGGNKFLITTTQSIGIISLDTNYWMVDGNNLYSAVKLDLSDKELAYKADAKVGDTFGPDSSFNEVVSLTESVVVPAGTFTCMKIKNYNKTKNPTTDYDFSYISPQAGLIKTEAYTKGKLDNSLKMRSKSF